MTIDWPPMYEPVDAADAAANVCARQVLKERQERSESADGVLCYAMSPNQCALSFILEGDATVDLTLTRFAIMNAVADALGASLPPMLPVTHTADGTLFLDGGIIGSIDIEFDSEPERSRETRSCIATCTLALSGEASTIQSLSGELLNADELSARIARYVLTWIETWQDRGFEPVRQAWNVRCQERLTKTAAGIDAHGKMSLVA